MDIADLRREYMYAGLSRRELHPDPIVQFERWFREATEADLFTPNALSLATVGSFTMSAWARLR